MLQAFLFIVTLPLTNVFCHFSDTDFQLWWLSPHSGQLTGNHQMHYLSDPSKTNRITTYPNPIMVRVWVGGSQFVCLQVVWGALNYCKNHNIPCHVPSEISSWSAGSDLRKAVPSKLLLGCFFKDGPGCAKLTRGHQSTCNFLRGCFNTFSGLKTPNHQGA